MKKQVICGVMLSLFSSMVLAHSGQGLNNAYTGFMHPFLGWDHLLMMIGVGVWAAKLTGPLRWELPMSFIGFMALGAGVGFLGFKQSGLETAIAASVMAMGVMLVINLPMPVIGRISIVAIFALLHGLAHGVELQNTTSQNMSVLFGILAATALLQGFGFIVGMQRQLIVKWLSSGLAFVMLVTGGTLLLS
jgi:urease accessory protein